MAFRQVRRYLEDLTLFEGDRIVVPEPAAAEIGEPSPAIPAADYAREVDEPILVDRSSDLEAFREQICNCMNCSLGSTRKSFVFGTGNPDAGIMFIGEAPGADEDRQGEPFVGKAGQLLTKIIEAMQLQRQDVYICNMLKCRPPKNRDPKPDEITQCEPYLKRQIELVNPKVICTLGRVATQAVLHTTLPMRAIRGRLHEYEGIPVIATYHPAALLRNAGLKKDTWEDVKWLRQKFDGVEIG